MKDENANPLVLITGASRGLGRCLAVAGAKRAHRLALTARDAAGLERLAAGLRQEHGCEVQCFPCDLSLPGLAQQCARHVEDSMGAPDVLINNAGIGWWRSFLEHSDEDHDRLIDLNFRAVVHLTHALLPAMTQRGHGQIINIASDLADRPLGNMAVYTATKHALRGFSHSLSQEVRPLGIKVSLLNPGMIDTSFHTMEEGSLDEAVALKPGPLAELVMTMLEQPGHQVVDEMTVHAMRQDY
jgi:short-subunit dehydrogenase